MNGKALSGLFGRATLLPLASLVVLLCNSAPLRAQVDAGSILEVNSTWRRDSKTASFRVVGCLAIARKDRCLCVRC